MPSAPIRWRQPESGSSFRCFAAEGPCSQFVASGPLQRCRPGIRYFHCSRVVFCKQKRYTSLCFLRSKHGSSWRPGGHALMRDLHDPGPCSSRESSPGASSRRCASSCWQPTTVNAKSGSDATNQSRLSGQICEGSSRRSKLSRKLNIPAWAIVVAPRKYLSLPDTRSRPASSSPDSSSALMNPP